MLQKDNMVLHCGNSVSRHVRNIVCYPGHYSDSASGTCHCNLVVLVRNGTIGAYAVVVILNVTSWLSGV